MLFFSISPELLVNVSKISYKKNNYMSYKTMLKPKPIKIKSQKNVNKQVKI